jgi:hypothetical protein
MLIPHIVSRKWFVLVSKEPVFVLPLDKRWRHGFVHMTIPCARATGYPR